MKIFVKKLFSISILVCIFLALPMTTFAAIRINEIAWMGTTNSANDEWIELYNSGSDSIDISGWTLVATDGSPAISLAGIISGNGYFLLERTDDSTVPTVSADHIYSGALGNDGEVLQLKNSTGDIIDTVDNDGEWVAGDNISKDTMQYIGSNWVTGNPTPKATNIETGTENNTEYQENSGGGSNSTNTESSNNVYDESKDVIDMFTLNLQVEPVVIANIPTEFIVGVYKNGQRQFRGVHSWSFGDGTFVQNNERRTTSDMVFQHTYRNTGTYVAVFEYRTSHLKKDPDITHRVHVHVHSPSIVLSSVQTGTSIELENTDNKEINIEGWTLRTGKESYVFPRNTFVLPNQKLLLHVDTIDMQVSWATTLQLPDGSIASSVLMDKDEGVVAYSSKQTSHTSSSIAQEPSLQPVTQHTGAATVLFAASQDADAIMQSSKQKHTNMFGWYVVLGMVIMITGGAVTVLFMNISKQPDDYPVADDITLLDD